MVLGTAAPQTPRLTLGDSRPPDPPVGGLPTPNPRLLRRVWKVSAPHQRGLGGREPITVNPQGYRDHQLLPMIWSL